MSSNLPNDFFSWKSFQSLTQTAALAWMILLVIDVIFIQRIPDPLSKVVWLWIVGIVLCLILAGVRLYFKEEKEKGDKLLMIFNAALIFLYASGYNGFTKELGSWSELNKIGQDKTSGLKNQVNAFDVTLASWVPNIFADQTAFWPDVKMINENRMLKVENEKLMEAFKTNTPIDSTDVSKKIQELVNENNSLHAQIQSGNNPPGGDSIKYLTNERNLALLQLKTLLKRVEESNQRIAGHSQMVKNSQELINQENMFYNRLRNEYAKIGGGEYVSQVRTILNTTIDTDLSK